VPRWRSSGVATLVAMVSGLAPGIWAWTDMVGKSTSGSGETGSSRKAATPAIAHPGGQQRCGTGRVIKGVEEAHGAAASGVRPAAGPRPAAAHAPGQCVEGEIDHRRG